MENEIPQYLKKIKMEKNKKSIERLASPQYNYDIGKIPPQALEMEDAVLGAIMMESESLEKVAELLQPRSFYRPANESIYNAICILKAEGNPIDIRTVVQQLKKSGELESVGGAFYISQLTNGVASSAHIEYHARVIYEKFIQREIIRINSEGIRKAYEEETNCFELLDENRKQLALLEPTFSKSQSVDDAYNEMFDSAQAALTSGGRGGLQCHIEGLNNILNGINPMLIVIGARPSIGKTALMKGIVLSLIKQRIKVKVFSMEVRASVFITNLLSEQFEIDSRDISNGRVSMENWQKMESFRNDYLKPYLDIDDTPAITIQYLEPRMKKAVENGCKLICIDYLQLMKVNKSDVPPTMREQQVAFLSANIVRLKATYNIPIIQLAQLGRGVEERKDKKPQLSDLRESGALEQDAEVVILIHRPEFYGIYETTKGSSLVGKAKLLIVKHRNGPLGTVNCNYTKEFTRFTDEDYLPPYGTVPPENKILPEDEPPF